MASVLREHSDARRRETRLQARFRRDWELYPASYFCGIVTRSGKIDRISGSEIPQDKRVSVKQTPGTASVQGAVALGVAGGHWCWLDDDRRQATLRFHRSWTKDRVQSECCAGVVRRALHPASYPIERTRNQRQRRIAGRDFCVEEPAVAAGTAVRRQLHAVMEKLLESAVGVRFPDGASSTMRTLVKDRLASNRESQIRTPQRRVRDRRPSPVAARRSNDISIYARAAISMQ